MKKLATYTPWPFQFSESYRALGYWKNQSLYQILEDSAEKFPNNIAVVEGDKAYSYGELKTRVDNLAFGFLEKGIKRSDHVVVHLPNCTEFFEVVFALFRIGVVPIMALATHRLHEIEHFCRQGKARTYIHPGKTAHFNYASIAEEIYEKGLVEHVITCEPLAAKCEKNDEDFSSSSVFTQLCDLYKTPPLGWFADRPRGRDLALLQLSGGTTNVSKLIPRTHDDYFYSIRASAEICELHENDVYLLALPVAHNFPLTSPGSLGVLYAGGTVVLSDDPSPDSAFPLIEKHAVSVTALVPPLAIAWMKRLESTDGSFPSLRLLQVGGAKLSESIATRLMEMFPGALQQVFGMAEGLVNYTRIGDPQEIIVKTQGRPISEHDEIKVVDDNDFEVPIGAFGHLLTRGPYTIRGYYNAAEHNKKAFTEDGFYRTGDIVRVNSDGYLTVEGRAKDQINRGGEKIAAEEVENILLAYEPIQDCALVSMPDEYLGERSCAFIIPTESDQASVKGIRLYLKERNIAPYKIPDRFEFVRDFPKTKFGKVNKQALRKMIEKQLSNA